MNEEKQTKKDVEEILLPKGTRVEIDVEGITAVVFPMGFKHIRAFSTDIGRVAALVVRTTEIRKDAGDGEIAAAVMAQALPVLSGQLVGLVRECVRFERADGSKVEVDLDVVPHWVVPPIIEAWLIESFGEERKWRPWLRAIENTIARVTGQTVSISETLSKLWSKRDTILEKSRGGNR